MARCKHQNIEIAEIFKTATTHFIEEGEYIDSLSDVEGNYTGQLIVRCFDCSGNWTYKRSNSPKWLLKYLAKIGI